MNNIVIGVDFDNTITDYDGLMHGLAFEAHFIDGNISPDKQKIRDHVRSLNDGEIKWQKLQAMAYGRFMPQAKLIEGVQDFFSGCHQQGIPVFIVSHKTQFAAQDEQKVDLHIAALQWMKEKRFFQNDFGGMALKEGMVFFEPSRQDKIERIRKLGCTHFIDDLLETFLEFSFPKGVQKILYAPHGANKISQNVLVKSNWEEIYGCFFTNIGK